MDNEDKDHVKVIGNWLSEKRGGYGPTFFVGDVKGSSVKSVQFIPTILKAAKYQAFAYFVKLENGSSQTSFKVFDGKKVNVIKIQKDNVKVVGQTSGEWVSLGTYTLPKGNKAYVEVSNLMADGAVVADAVLFVPVK